MPADYREDLLDWFTNRLMRDPDVQPGRMMGHPGFGCVSNNKLFLMFSGDGILLKVPPSRYEEMLARDDVIPFAPMNAHSPMGTWIVWTMIDAEEYEPEWSIIIEAINHVAAEPPNPKKRRKKKG